MEEKIDNGNFDFNAGLSSLKDKIKEISISSTQTEIEAEKLRKQLNERQNQLQKELADIHERQLELDNLFYDLKLWQSTDNNFGPSTILTKSDKKNLTKLCHFSLNTKWQLIYRASDDGFTAKSFHQKCDNVKSTLTIIKTADGFIFGGYTDASWNITNDYVRDENAFIFSLTNQQNTPLLMRTSHPHESIYSHPNYGPVFGKGHDIFIADNSNQNTLSHAYICHTYEHPKYLHSKTEAMKFLAGRTHFQTAEIEVFKKLSNI